MALNAFKPRRALSALSALGALGALSGALACISACALGVDADPGIDPGADPAASELAQAINRHRRQRGLTAIAHSPSLERVAQLHVRDLAAHSPQGPCNLHSWSDQGPWTPCCYTSDHAQAACMWSKPAELSKYPGYGYEISAAGVRSPEDAVTMWRMSDAHHEVILNQGVWAARPWGAMGAAIHEGYAVVWFGEEPEPR